MTLSPCPSCNGSGSAVVPARLAADPARDDDGARASLVAALVGRRESLGLTISHVAQRMQVAHGTVAALERGGADPRLSVLQMYARAVGLRIAVDVEADAGVAH